MRRLDAQILDGAAKRLVPFLREADGIFCSALFVKECQERRGRNATIREGALLRSKIARPHGRVSALLRSSKALTKQVGHLYKECATVAPKAWFELTAERAEAIPIQIIVVADVKCRSRVGRPAK